VRARVARDSRTSVHACVPEREDASIAVPTASQ
jgi:hypothetical protein